MEFSGYFLPRVTVKEVVSSTFIIGRFDLWFNSRSTCQPRPFVFVVSPVTCISTCSKRERRLVLIITVDSLQTTTSSTRPHVITDHMSLPTTINLSLSSLLSAPSSTSMSSTSTPPTPSPSPSPSYNSNHDHLHDRKKIPYHSAL